MQFITGPKLNGAAASTGALSPEVIAVYPMTKAQESLWLAYSMAPNHTLYNLSLKFVFNQTEAASDGHGFTLENISKAIRDLTRRHAILRSTFHGANQSQARPFVAEHNPDTATASFRIVPKPRDARGEAKVLGLLRTAVNLSQEFASRWLAVVSDREIELYLVAHHIALDGTSMSSISAELFKLLSGSPATPAEQPFCQAHMYEAAFSASPEYQAAERFWLDQVMHVRPYKWITNPSSRPAPSKSYREIQTWFDFSKDDLAAWGSKYRTSWFRVAVAMVGLLTRAHTEPDYGADQTVTVAFGGRPAGLEKSIGHFANAMPIRIPFTEASRKTSGAAQVSFDNLVKLVSKQISTAKKHERYSILDLSRARASRGLETPRAQVAVTLSPKLSHKECTLYPVEGPYDLFFCFLEGDDNVTLGVIYDPIIFSTADVARLKDEFSSLRERSMTDPSFGVSGISGVQSHLPRLLPELDLSNVDEISAARFHAWFEQQALAHPNLVALHSAERNLSVTYKELNERSNRLGHYLREIGISRGSLVLLYLEHGPAVMEWIIAVLKAGAAYAVADQSNPPERIRSIVSVAEPVLVIHDQKGEAIREIIQESPVKTLDIRTVQIEKFSSESLEEVTQNTDLAYIVFTSGSTGQPKGVEIEHRNLSHFVANAFTSNYTTIGPGTRVLQLATFAFDAAVLEWSQCLSLGGTLCFADVPKALVGDYLADVIDLNEVSFMHLTPSVLATLPTSRPLPSLRQISVGGEMVPDNLIKKWRSRVQVVNAYGPTECTVVMAHQPQPIASDAPQPAANIIGAAHQHMKFYVSNDAFTRLLPAGEVGEVCIGGPQVGRGYKSRPDLTENRFAVHPELGARLYRTGDRGKLLGDGSVFLVGRIDREVKVRGYRIELDDVERTITDVMPEVTAVSVQPDSSSTSLWAFVSPDDIDGDVLRNRLTERLPAYMVPSTVYALPQLPLNMNGKVDHKSIAANMESLIVEATTSGSSSSATPSLVSSGSTTCRSPSTSSCSDSRSASPAITSAVTRIWQDILGTKGLITTSDNFFDLGGNSLSANKLATQLRSEFSSSNITVLDIFSSPTIQGQVDLLCGSELDSYVQSKLDSYKPVIPQPVPSPQADDMEDIQMKIAEIWKSVLGSRNAFTYETNFFDAGGHSVSVSQVLQGLQKEWPSVKVGIVDLFQHSTISSMAALVAKYQPASQLPEVPDPVSVPRLGRGRTKSPATIVDSQGRSSPSTIPSGGRKSEIAIVGISGRFPGASNPDELYRLFRDRKEGISELEGSSGVLPFPGAIYVPRRGAIKDVEYFDPAAWGLKEDEARNMDPQQRLFMESTLRALQDANRVPSIQGTNNIGLFVGAARDTWQDATETVYGDEFYRTHRADLTPSISARTAYHLNLQGPNVTLNTACSSGMVALSVAVDQLRAGRCDMAVAGAVAIAFPQEGYVTAESQIFSPSGHCRPFDHRADGTLPADGVCALVLRPLDDAVRDGDKIYSVISGIATGSDGRLDKAGVTAPSPRGQADTIERAWKDAGIPMSKAVYAELHGSGTPIGDALELEGFQMARSRLGAANNRCTVGSNKGNLGNCEAASGLVSVIKMCKSMQYGVIPPVQSLERVNPLINPSLPFDIAQTDLPLSDDAVVCVSSTGLGGVNAHCVLRSPPTTVRRSPQPSRSTSTQPRGKLLTAPPRVSLSPTSDIDIGQIIAVCASQVLGSEVGKDADLRAAGLDSTGQVRLMRLLADALPSAPLSMSAFLGDSLTPEVLASRCFNAATNPSPPSVGGNGKLPPYFTLLRCGEMSEVYALLAPAGGSCGSYIDLCRQLPPGGAVIGVEHPNLNLNASGPTPATPYSVSELADRYADDLARIGVKEVVLVGSSFGGVVCVELARLLLQKEAMTVKGVALLDSPWPSMDVAVEALTWRAFLRNLFDVTSAEADAQIGPGSALEMSLSAHAAAVETLTAEITAALALVDGSQRAAVERRDWKKLLTIYAENVLALGEYSQQGPIPGLETRAPSLYVRAGSRSSEHVDSWGGVLEGMRVEEVDGGHAGVCSGERAGRVAAFLAEMAA